MMTRLCNIVLRRPYLIEYVPNSQSTSDSEYSRGAAPSNPTPKTHRGKRSLRTFLKTSFAMSASYTNKLMPSSPTVHLTKVSALK